MIRFSGIETLCDLKIVQIVLWEGPDLLWSYCACKFICIVIINTGKKLLDKYCIIICNITRNEYTRDNILSGSVSKWFYRFQMVVFNFSYCFS